MIVPKENEIEALSLVYTVRYLASIVCSAAAGAVLERVDYQALFAIGCAGLLVGNVITWCYRLPEGKRQNPFGGQAGTPA